MDNHEEEKEPLIAQSRAGEAGANLTDVLERKHKKYTETIFRFVRRPAQYIWEHKANILPGDIDCTDMSDEEFETFVRSNVEFSGGAPLHGAASAGTQGYASADNNKENAK